MLLTSEPLRDSAEKNLLISGKPPSLAGVLQQRKPTLGTVLVCLFSFQRFRQLLSTVVLFLIIFVLKFITFELLFAVLLVRLHKEIEVNVCVNTNLKECVRSVV